MKKPLEHYLFIVSLVPFVLWILVFCVMWFYSDFAFYTMPEAFFNTQTVLLLLTPIIAICSGAHCIIAAIRKRFNRRMLIPLCFGLLPALFFGASVFMVYIASVHFPGGFTF